MTILKKKILRVKYLWIVQKNRSRNLFLHCNGFLCSILKETRHFKIKICQDSYFLKSSNHAFIQIFLPTSKEDSYNNNFLQLPHIILKNELFMKKKTSKLNSDDWFQVNKTPNTIRYTFHLSFNFSTLRVFFPPIHTGCKIQKWSLMQTGERRVFIVMVKASILHVGIPVLLSRLWLLTLSSS